VVHLFALNEIYCELKVALVPERRVLIQAVASKVVVGPSLPEEDWHVYPGRMIRDVRGAGVVFLPM